MLDPDKVEVPVEWESDSQDERDAGTVEKSFERAREELPTPPDRTSEAGRKNFSAQVARTWAHSADALRGSEGIVHLEVHGDKPYNRPPRWLAGTFVVVPPAAKGRIRLGETPAALRARVDPPRRTFRVVGPPIEPPKPDEPKPPPGADLDVDE